jgi:UDP-2,3-diacylglucosamine pyrophosphatase LpxH
VEINLKTQERSVRTVIVSDIHLGCRFAQAEHFLTFLRSVRPEQIYILGDFLDGWELRARWHWKSVYTQVIDRLFELAEGGTELYYTPGNHDEFLRIPDVQTLLEKSNLRVHIRDEFIFKTQDGKRFIVLHGDRFDIVEQKYQWLSIGTTYLYAPLLAVNSWLSRKWGHNGSRYSMCAFIKNKVKTAVRFFSHFEDSLRQYIERRHCDGIICGHIHTPGVTKSEGKTYINCGDWVENCTALVEHCNGELILESFFSKHVAAKYVFPAEVVTGEISGERIPEFADAAELDFESVASSVVVPAVVIATTDNEEAIPVVEARLNAVDIPAPPNYANGANGHGDSRNSMPSIGNAPYFEIADAHFPFLTEDDSQENRRISFPQSEHHSEFTEGPGRYASPVVIKPPEERQVVYAVANTEWGGNSG